MSRDFQRIEELYHQALSRPEADRANFLASTCAGDAELRREVDALLACQQKAGQFMDSPALDVAARILARTNDRTLTGSRLGPYQVLSLLGVGGMGEVYRALDTQLNRHVALKVLPEALAQAPERMARFQREAQMLAALNHPNIAAIYGLEESRRNARPGDGARGRTDAGRAPAALSAFTGILSRCERGTPLQSHLVQGGTTGRCALAVRGSPARSRNR